MAASKGKKRAQGRRNPSRGLLRPKQIRAEYVQGQAVEFDLVPLAPLRTADDVPAYLEHLRLWAGIASGVAGLGADAEELPKVIAWDIAQALEVLVEALRDGTVPELCMSPRREFRNMIVRVVEKALAKDATDLLGTADCSTLLRSTDPLLPTTAEEFAA